MFSLEGRRLLITGVVTTDSIAFAAASRAQGAGADVLLTALPRTRELTVEAASALPSPPDVLDLDATRPEDHAALSATLRERWGGVDGALHAIAFAPRQALGGDFAAVPSEAVELAFRTSTHSYALLAATLRDLFPEGGGSLVGLSFLAERAWGTYGWMGVCKAALEATNRYVARDLGTQGARANIVTAGPLKTRAAGGIPDFDVLLDAWERSSALPWDPDDATPVADACLFLLSDAARAITAANLHVDAGFHAMAGALR